MKCSKLMKKAIFDIVSRDKARFRAFLILGETETKDTLCPAARRSLMTESNVCNNREKATG
jgi:hypothetical protein